MVPASATHSQHVDYLSDGVWPTLNDALKWKRSGSTAVLAPPQPVMCCGACAGDGGLVIESLVWLTAEVLLLGGVEVRGGGAGEGEGEEQDDAYVMALQLERWGPGSGQPPTSVTVAHYIPSFMDVSRLMAVLWKRARFWGSWGDLLGSQDVLRQVWCWWRDGLSRAERSGFPDGAVTGASLKAHTSNTRAITLSSRTRGSSSPD